MSIRLVLADDHQVFRSGLRALLERESDLEVVGEAGTTDEVLAVIAQPGVDVLLLDLSMPGALSGAKLAEEIRSRHPSLRIVILTMHEDPYYLRELFRVGVHGYVVKKMGVDEVVTAVRAASKGEYYVDASLGGQAVSELVTPAPIPREGRLGQLTARERDVCRMLALGYTNSETGEKLFISERTVESHRTNIMSKLDLKNRAELVRFALDHGLIR